MARSVYVDDVFVGVDTVKEAKEYYHVSKGIFAGAQMNLCKYVSNSPEANRYFTEQEKTEPETAKQRLLGIDWNIDSDVLVYSLPKPKPGLLTMRKVLKTIASCYDPQGMLTSAEPRIRHATFTR
ncbi:hypothetical protein CRE_27446 [Caenorhabditis remanei]|uniref:Uncharacterized protein n=1 Tax=Caenorhabditis remanei TaxID=31234 RepID=E3LNN2_CAERE|nr:hypothetical protein CRE_27446 [Caenorhabditis remanei]